MIMGLTGGIATGKSTVSQMFKDRGALIVDADKIAREVVEPGTKGLELVMAEFGEDFRRADGTLNRPKLSEYVFNDNTKLKKLNNLLHPLIREVMSKRTQEYLAHNPKSIIIWDVPLLIESQLTHCVEGFILVYTTEFIQLDRLVDRNKISVNDAKKLTNSQLSIEYKKKLATYIIDNTKDLNNTERQVEKIWAYLMEKNQ